MSRKPDHEWVLTVLEMHQRLIHKVCWVYAESHSDRDDLFQEIAVRLLSALRHYDRTRRLSTWVYRVAMNVAIDFQRKRRRRRSVTLGFDGDQASKPAERPERAEQLSELRSMLGQQTEVDRALLLLHLNGSSHSEIGEVLGMSESNVGTRLNRLKKSLRESASAAKHDCPSQ